MAKRRGGAKSGVKDAAGIRCAESAVDAHISWLSQKFSEHSAETVAVKPLAEKWKRRLGGDVSFEAFPSGGQYEFSQSRRRKQSPLVELGTDETLREELDRLINWYFYREVWCRAGGRDWSFQQAGFTFYCGFRGGGEKSLTFRAEWAQPGAGSDQAANPHWHSAAGETLDATGVHLGMSGWENDSTSPACWQRGASDPKEIRLWAGQTLHYMREQLDRHPPKLRANLPL